MVKLLATFASVPNVELEEAEAEEVEEAEKNVEVNDMKPDVRTSENVEWEEYSRTKLSESTKVAIVF